MTEYNLTLGQAIDAMRDGKKVQMDFYSKNVYIKIHNNKRFSFFNMDKDTFDSDFIIACDVLDASFKVYEPKEKPKLITWYRPKVVFLPTRAEPVTCNRFYKNKSDFFEENTKFYVSGTKTAKILNDEWETIEAPEYNEDW